MRIPQEALLSFDRQDGAPLSESVLAQNEQSEPVLPLPDADQSTVWFQARVARFGERTHKGWALNHDRVGAGWESMAGKFVNMSHDPTRMYGRVDAVVKAGDDVFANVALYRQKLVAENMDPGRIKLDLSVSPEWMYRPAESVVEKDGKEYSIEEAAGMNLLDLQETPLGVPEIVVTDPQATMWVGGVHFHNLGLVPRRDASPNFPSATILSATNAVKRVDTSAITDEGSMEDLERRLDEALKKSFQKEGDYVWRYRTFSTQIIYSHYSDRGGESKYFRVPWTIDTDGEIKFGDPTEVESHIVFQDVEDASNLMLNSYPSEVRFLYKQATCAGLLYGEGAVPSVKKGGRKSPPKGYPTSKAQYADPTNYAYRLDNKAVAKNAEARFHYAVEGKQYSRAELVFMARRIVAALRKYDVEPNADSLVGRYAGLKKSKSSEATNSSVAEKASSLWYRRDRNSRGGENSMPDTYTQAEVDALLKDAKAEGFADGQQATIKDVLENQANETRVAVIGQFKETELPALLTQAENSGRDKAAKETEALTALNEVTALTDAERTAYSEKFRSGSFDLTAEINARKVSKYESAAQNSTATTPDPNKAAAGQQMLNGGAPTAQATNDAGAGEGGAEEIGQIF